VVLVQLGRVEPQVDLVLRFFWLARGVHQVRDRLAGRDGDRLGLMREVAADRAGLGLVRVGRADDLAHRGHRVFALDHERDDRTALHELRRGVVNG